MQGDRDEDGESGPVEVGEETAQAMLASVEEMLEGYELAGGDLLGGGRGTTDQIEARLLDELSALEKVISLYNSFAPRLISRTARPTYTPSLNPMTESTLFSNILKTQLMSWIRWIVSYRPTRFT